jgi:DNA-binding NarL/FixJ family response regulator
VAARLFVVPGILIVDDNPSIRYLLRVCVESKTGFAVCGEAGHGMEAIERARELNPDLIILDLFMPIMNGAEAAVVLKRSMPEVKIILFTMHADNIGKALAAAVGIDLTLSKSDGLLKLDEHVKALLTQTPPAMQAEDLTRSRAASGTNTERPA